MVIRLKFLLHSFGYRSVVTLHNSQQLDGLDGFIFVELWGYRILKWADEMMS